MNAKPGDHSVVFYHDNELARVVGEYLLGAITDGGVAVIVATPEHRLWVNAWLMQAGVDLSAVTANGSYIVLDARRTMDGFVVGEWPDTAAFWNVLSPILASATRRRRTVRVFGEMVALLWEADQVEAAIEVESLWNEMAGQFSFSLLCAYPQPATADTDNSDALARVYDAHSRICGMPTAGK
jgi:MEDS: MEthanogen/methylotroph, DcmR Sensory domain